MPDDIRWIRSYVLEEGNGVGTVCIYQASSPEAIRGARRRPTCRSTRSSRVADTVIVRPDPGPRDRLSEGDRDEPEETRTDARGLVVLPVLVAVGVAVAAGALRRRERRRPTAFHDCRAGEGGRLHGPVCRTWPGSTCIAAARRGRRWASTCSTRRSSTATIDDDRSPRLLVYEPTNDGTLKLVAARVPRLRGRLDGRRQARRSSGRSSTTIPRRQPLRPARRSTRCTRGSGSRTRAGSCTPGTPVDCDCSR